MTINLSALQKQRRDTAANWTAEDPTLLAGEIGLESDTGYWKVGDGATAWTSLAYVSGLGAEIPVDRLADGAARQLLQTDAAGTGVEWTDNVDVPGTLDVTGAGTFDGNVTIAGDLTVNGTTTTINTQDLLVEDKNIIIGNVTTPSDVTADGGGITLKGTTDKTINWVDATDAWTLSEHVNIASGKEYRIDGTKVLDATSLGSSVLITSANITDGTIVDGDVNASAAIAGTKISPDFGSQNVTTTGTVTGASLNPTSSTVPTNGVYLPSANTVGISSNGAERMRIDSSGKFLVGTDLDYAENVQAAFYGASNGGISLAAGTSGLSRLMFADATAGNPGAYVGSIIYSHVDDSLRFNVNGGAERLRIDSSGRLLVGTSSSRSAAGLASEIAVETAQGFPSMAIIANTTTTGQEPRLVLGRSKGSTKGSSTVVADGDSLGNIQFAGADGTDLNSTAASIRAYVDGTPGANDMPGRLVFSVTRDGQASPTEAFRIGWQGYATFWGGNSDSINVTTQNGAGTAYRLIWGGYSSSGPGNYGTNCFAVYTNGDVVNTNNSYTALSDIKLKENIADANSQWSDIKALQVRNYNLKEGQTHRQIGLIAQEVEPICPGLVYEAPDRDADGNDLGTTTKAVQYSVLYMKAVKALQEAMERIEQLETEMAEVKAQLS